MNIISKTHVLYSQSATKSAPQAPVAQAPTKSVQAPTQQKEAPSRKGGAQQESISLPGSDRRVPVILIRLPQQQQTEEVPDEQEQIQEQQIQSQPAQQEQAEQSDQQEEDEEEQVQQQEPQQQQQQQQEEQLQNNPQEQDDEEDEQEQVNEAPAPAQVPQQVQEQTQSRDEDQQEEDDDSGFSGFSQQKDAFEEDDVSSPAAPAPAPAPAAQSQTPFRPLVQQQAPAKGQPQQVSQVSQVSQVARQPTKGNADIGLTESQLQNMINLVNSQAVKSSALRQSNSAPTFTIGGRPLLTMPQSQIGNLRVDTASSSSSSPHSFSFSSTVTSAVPQSQPPQFSARLQAQPQARPQFVSNTAPSSGPSSAGAVSDTSMDHSGFDRASSASHQRGMMSAPALMSDVGTTVNGRKLVLLLFSPNSVNGGSPVSPDSPAGFLAIQ